MRSKETIASARIGNDGEAAADDYCIKGAEEMRRVKIHTEVSAHIGRHAVRLFLTLCILSLVAGCGRKPAAPSDAERDRRFQEMMTKVTLVGRSTSFKREGLSGEERYAIDKVSKLTGDTWLFQTRMKYGSQEIPVPIPIAIQWAGDTPVITLTDLSIPGAGTYTARVLLYGGHYAGTWSGKTVGGQLFGRIVRDGQP